VQELSAYTPRFEVANTPVEVIVFDDTNTPEAMTELNNPIKTIVAINTNIRFLLINLCSPATYPKT
jgi:hypothetical protein